MAYTLTAKDQAHRKEVFALREDIRHLRQSYNNLMTEAATEICELEEALKQSNALLTAYEDALGVSREEFLRMQSTNQELANSMKLLFEVSSKYLR